MLKSLDVTRNARGQKITLDVLTQCQALLKAQ